MDRRAFLLGAAGTVTLAGCTANNNTTTGRTDDLQHAERFDGVQVTPQRLVPAVEIRDNSRNQYLADPGHVFVLLKIRAKNTGGSTRSLLSSSSLVVVMGETQYDTIDGATFPIDGFARPVAGPRYSNESDAAPGVATAGWLAFELPQTEQFRLYWTTAETDWNLDIVEGYPDIVIDDISVPEAPHVAQTIPIEITVTNHGRQSGTLTTTATVDTAFETTEHELEIEAPASETVTRTIQRSLTSLGSITASVDQPRLGNTATAEAEVGPATTDIGSTPAGEGLPRITVEKPRIEHNYQIETASSSESRAAGSDTMFAIFEVEYENETDETVAIPEYDDFSLTVDGQFREMESFPPFAYDPQIVDPVTGTYPTADALGAGESYEGLLIVEIPRDWTEMALDATWDLHGWGSGDAEYRWTLTRSAYEVNQAE